MKERLDKELVNRKLVPTRTKAQELINNKKVLVNDLVIGKCNYLVCEEDNINLLENNILKYVSRGGLKLEKAINEFKIDFKDKIVMDVGSSTGGFSDCALKHGAKHIIAIDVGTNVMVDSLRNDKRISLFEKTNFKEFDNKYFNDIDIIVVDVSFISLLKIIEKVKSTNILVDMVVLIKPQFECGIDIANKYKGVILNKDIHLDILNNIIYKMNQMNFYINNLDYSPIKVEMVI